MLLLLPILHREGRTIAPCICAGSVDVVACASTCPARVSPTALPAADEDESTATRRPRGACACYETNSAAFREAAESPAGDAARRDAPAP